MKKLLGIVVAIFVLNACSSDTNTNEPLTEPVSGVDFERGTMLVNWADNIIIPSYEAFSTEIESLNESFNLFKTAPTEANLLNLRSTWLQTYKSWQHVSMFEIGPAETVGLRLNLNIYPTDFQKIESNISSGSYDLALSSNRDAKGFPALDYLLNGLEDNDIAIVSKYNSTNKEALMMYMEAVLNDMTTLSNDVLAGWKQGYRDSFVANDGASSTASVDRMVNDIIFYYEKFLRAGKMGIPLGVFSGSTLPEKLEGYYKKDISNVLFLEGLNAVQDFFNGKHFNSNAKGESLASYLDALNTLKARDDLATRINDQFDIARSSVSALAPFLTEIQNNMPPTTMLMAYDEVQKAIPMLKVDMVSAMSISVDFVDADGD